MERAISSHTPGDGTPWHTTSNGTLVKDEAGAERENEARIEELEEKWPFPGKLLPE